MQGDYTKQMKGRQNAVGMLLESVHILSKVLQSRRVLVCCWTAEGTPKSDNTMIVFTKQFW